MRKFLFLFFVLSLTAPGLAKPRPAGFAEAEARFDSLDANAKATYQIMMGAAGYWAQMPRPDYSLRLFEDTQRFQGDLGHPPTGILTKAEFNKLFSLAIPNLRYWGFRQMTHPTRGRPIWVPMGIGGKIVPHGNDVSFEGNGVEISYKYLLNVQLDSAYDFMLNKLRDEGQNISYRVMHKGFFAISAEKDGTSEYFRYHQDGAGLLGFTMFWRNNDAPIYGNRIVALVSGSLSNQMLGTPMIPVPRFDEATPPRTANNYEQPPAAASLEGLPNALAPPAKPKASFSSGSGFFVGSDGDVLTNNHVIEDCTSIRVFMDQAAAAEARVIARDASNDLALLSTALKPIRKASPRTNVRLGESVAAFGYPHADVLASSGNFTLGNVTALAGIRDDSRYLQISAPVQAGNSGGPLLDQNGNLVGIVTAKLNALKIAAASGDLPQNVNFALKASTVANFLDTNRIKYAPGSSTVALKPEDLADQARSMSVFILCK
ncbi:MAG: S1C family serine protease [Methylocella sp.]